MFNKIVKLTVLICLISFTTAGCMSEAIKKPSYFCMPNIDNQGSCKDQYPGVKKDDKGNPIPYYAYDKILDKEACCCNLEQEPERRIVIV